MSAKQMLVLLAMSPVVLIASMVSVSRVLMLAPRPDFLRRVWWAMNGVGARGDGGARGATVSVLGDDDVDSGAEIEAG